MTVALSKMRLPSGFLLRRSMKGPKHFSLVLSANRLECERISAFDPKGHPLNKDGLQHRGRLWLASGPLIPKARREQPYLLRRSERLCDPAIRRTPTASIS